MNAEQRLDALATTIGASMQKGVKRWYLPRTQAPVVRALVTGDADLEGSLACLRLTVAFILLLRGTVASPAASTLLGVLGQIRSDLAPRIRSQARPSPDEARGLLERALKALPEELKAAVSASSAERRARAVTDEGAKAIPSLP